MSEKMIIITSDDKLKSVDYNGFESLSREIANGDSFSYCGRQDIPTIPALADGKDHIEAIFYCDDNCAISNDARFDKINAVATLITGNEVCGDVAMLFHEGNGVTRGFKYFEEEVGDGVFEQALCEHWTVEDTLMRFMHDCKEDIQKLHKEGDRKSKTQKSQERE